MNPILRMIAIPLATCLLASCGWIGQSGPTAPATAPDPPSHTSSWLKKLKPDLPDISLASLLPGPKINIVEPRSKDLKELPTGSELAKNRRRQPSAGFWMFPDKLYFEEADFPAPGADLDGGLLPPPVQ